MLPSTGCRATRNVLSGEALGDRGHASEISASVRVSVTLWMACARQWFHHRCGSLRTRPSDRCARIGLAARAKRVEQDRPIRISVGRQVDRDPRRTTRYRRSRCVQPAAAGGAGARSDAPPLVPARSGGRRPARQWRNGLRRRKQRHRDRATQDELKAGDGRISFFTVSRAVSAEINKTTTRCMPTMTATGTTASRDA